MTIDTAGLAGTTDPVGTLYTIDHHDVVRVAGPLLVVDAASSVAYGDLVEVVGDDGRVREGQVLEVDDGRAVVQVLGGTDGLGVRGAAVRARSRPAVTGVGIDYLGRILDGAGRARDGQPDPLPEAFRPVAGMPLNPVARAHPDQFIETGVSAIDGLNTLVRGQKLPVFTAAGLPAGELAARIATQARVPGEDTEVIVVFAAMGVTRREADFFAEEFRRGGAAERNVLLLNLADDPTIERLLTPRVALTLAEYLAFELHRHVLVILTDVTAYCEALREVSAAREEMPGRRGYPGYLYTDLASLFERAGRVHGSSGSLTQLSILTMPDGDITHPVPDLTGYITEGQIVLSREVLARGVQPPVDVLPSLSRLMNSGVGEGRTREDHRNLADQLYACYARGTEVRRLASIVGDAGLTDEDRRYLAFAERFERDYVGQGSRRRSLEETLDLGWRLLDDFPPQELKRVKPHQLERHHRKA
ncbi:MAG: V-type ATP synthase subunit B [Dermatophilaceae bacterium]